MREYFWSIYKFKTYIQLGKNYTLYAVIKNKEGQWIEKKIINFLRLLKLSPYRCKKCGRKILYTEYFLKKSINEKNYKKIKIFYCKHCENKEEVVKKYFNKIQKG